MEAANCFEICLFDPINLSRTTGFTGAFYIIPPVAVLKYNISPSFGAFISLNSASLRFIATLYLLVISFIFGNLPCKCLLYLLLILKMMEELTYKPEDPSGHPNFELEEDFKSVEMLVELGNNEDDLKNIYYLKDKIFKLKFNAADIALFNQFKERYLKKSHSGIEG